MQAVAGGPRTVLFTAASPSLSSCGPPGGVNIAEPPGKRRKQAPRTARVRIVKPASRSTNAAKAATKKAATTTQLGKPMHPKAC